MAQIELIFHCKAVEMLTNGFKGLVSIDTSQDLQEFRQFFSVVEAQGVAPTQADSLRNQPLPPIKKSPSHPELDTSQKLPETQSSSLLRRFNSTPSVLTDDRRPKSAPSSSNRRDEEEEDESEEDEEGEGGGSGGEESEESDMPSNEPPSSSSTSKGTRPASARR